MQKSFSALEYDNKRKQTRRDGFPGEFDRPIPWKELEQVIVSYYPQGAGPGRPPIGLLCMLKITVVQNCFGLSDEGMEDSIYDSQSI